MPDPKNLTPIHKTVEVILQRLSWLACQQGAAENAAGALMDELIIADRVLASIPPYADELEVLCAVLGMPNPDEEGAADA